MRSLSFKPPNLTALTVAYCVRKIRVTRTAFALATVAALAACATPAPPFPSTLPSDAQLSCTELRTEMERMQTVRNAAREKIPPSAAMATSGSFLWAVATANFHANEMAPVIAADARIGNLAGLMREKKCTTP